MKSTYSDEAKRVHNEYSYVYYPEDIKEHKELRQFKEVFQEYSPTHKPEPEDEYENEDLTVLDDPVDLKKL